MIFRRDHTHTCAVGPKRKATGEHILVQQPTQRSCQVKVEQPKGNIEFIREEDEESVSLSLYVP